MQATPTVHIITSTLPPSPTARASDTPGAPTLAPTTTPIEGTTTTQVNLRAEPSTASSALAVLAPFTTVHIVGKDSEGNWYQILHPQGPDGKGWVTSIYIQSDRANEIPVIGAASGDTAVALQQINVRSGPGTDFNSLGTLNPQDVVTLTGKNAAGTWLQVEYAAGPEGRGWVNAGFVQVAGPQTGNLPIVAESGQVVGTGTPTGVPPTVTPTVAVSADDNDSATNPALQVNLSPSGSRSVFYTSDLSSPEGDADDWVAFTPSASAVAMSVECSGTGVLEVDLIVAGQTAPGWPGLECNTTDQVVFVTPGGAYLLHLQIAPAQGSLDSIRYTVSISTV